MICETWATEECIETHKNTRHYKEFKEAINGFSTIKIEKFDFNVTPDSIH